MEEKEHQWILGNPRITRTKTRSWYALTKTHSKGFLEAKERKRNTKMLQVQQSGTSCKKL